MHGITGTPTEMRPLMQHLLRCGYRVKTPVLAGHGAGYREMLDATWEDWLSGAQEAVDALAADCSQVIVVGLSAAALLAVLAAVDQPAVSGLVLLSVHLGRPGNRISRADYLISRLMAGFPSTIRRRWYFHERPPYGLKNERLQRAIRRAIISSKRGETPQFGLFRTYAETLYQIRYLEDAARRAAPRLRCPTLLIHSFEDTMLHIHNAAEMYGLLGTPDKAVTFITGCDHVIPVDLRKRDVAHRVERFVARVASPVAQREGAAP